jgi:hypothetical protein
MTLQDFADLIGRYRQAAEARRVLAEAGSSPARATPDARAPQGPHP